MTLPSLPTIAIPLHQRTSCGCTDHHHPTTHVFSSLTHTVQGWREHSQRQERLRKEIKCQREKIFSWKVGRPIHGPHCRPRRWDWEGGRRLQLPVVQAKLISWVDLTKKFLGGKKGFPQENNQSSHCCIKQPSLVSICSCYVWFICIEHVAMHGCVPMSCMVCKNWK